MKRPDSERQLVWEAQRLKRNLRWGRGQLWVGAVGYIAMGLFWFMGDRTGTIAGREWNPSLYCGRCMSSTGAPG